MSDTITLNELILMTMEERLEKIQEILKTFPVSVLEDAKIALYEEVLPTSRQLSEILSTLKDPILGQNVIFDEIVRLYRPIVVQTDDSPAPVYLPIFYNLDSQEVRTVEEIGETICHQKGTIFYRDGEANAKKEYFLWSSTDSLSRYLDRKEKSDPSFMRMCYEAEEERDR